MSEPLIGRHRPRETRLVAEYLVQAFPLEQGWTVRQRVPLGPPMEEAVAAFGAAKGLRASRPFRPEVTTAQGTTTNLPRFFRARERWTSSVAK